MAVAAIVVAAGQGTRFGGLKQFAALAGRTVAAQSVERARSVADQVILVVPSDYEGTGEGADDVVVGGDTRSASVRAGLARCSGADVIVVHDAARPFATETLFASVVAAVTNGADGAVPGVAVTDTIKSVRREGTQSVVDATPDRDSLVAVQTPQAFRADALRAAHATGGAATDDAALLEQAGLRVVVVAGETSNIKITVPSDLGV
jgi:2-C-methyl-D-erythritol 4-phosphate cytidylyltransferase